MDAPNKAVPGGGNGMEPNMDQPPLDENDPRYIARRIFKALCARYPDRYIALIEQPPLHAAEHTAKDSQKPML
jgi:hypothetical protein